MVLAEYTALQFLILIFAINGLHSSPGHQRSSLGVLSELIGQGSRSPLIVVVDTVPHARILDEEVDRGHQKSSYSNYKHYSDKKSQWKSYDNDIRDNNYEQTLSDILRASQLLLENQRGQNLRDRNVDRQGPYSAEKCTAESADRSCSGEKKC